MILANAEESGRHRFGRMSAIMRNYFTIVSRMSMLLYDAARTHNFDESGIVITIDLPEESDSGGEGSHLEIKGRVDSNVQQFVVRESSDNSQQTDEVGVNQPEVVHNVQDVPMDLDDVSSD